MVSSSATETAGRSGSRSGYFDDSSLLRRVHSERVVALSGPRALLMQAAHPLAVSGLLAHSTTLDEPYERLARTAEVMDAIGFGSREEADRVTAHVRAMHARVSGRLAAPTGRYEAGTPYRADDPELLLWVLFTLVDSAIVVFSKYVRHLRRDEQEALWRDYRLIGRLFGLRDEEMPADLDALDAYRERMLAGDDLHVSEWARTRARQIVLEPPVPWVARPLLEAANFITVALLPDRIRREYGFAPIPPAALRRAMVAGGAEWVKRVLLPVLPARLRWGPDRADVAPRAVEHAVA